MYIYIYILFGICIAYCLLPFGTACYLLLNNSGQSRASKAERAKQSEQSTAAPKDYTKPRQIIQSPDRLSKAPEDVTKPQKSTQRPNHIRQKQKYEKVPHLLNKSSNN